MEKVRIVILAGGKGTRMQSPLPKVLAELKGKHMIRHLLQSVDETGIDPSPLIVVGYEKDLVMKELGNKYQYVIQEEQLGTGHAVAMAEKACAGGETIIVISGDQPFIKGETIKKLVGRHLESGATITITSTKLPDFEDWRSVFLKFGRVMRENGKITDKEYQDATDAERKITEVNASCYAFNAKWLWGNIKKLNNTKNAQAEYYLTDLWEIASVDGEKIESIQIEPMEALSANSKEELEILEKLTL